MFCLTFKPQRCCVLTSDRSDVSSSITVAANPRCAESNAFVCNAFSFP